MKAGRRVLIGGGARSGKSSFAVRLARRMGERRVYLATGEAGDSEMKERIERHVRERGDDFRTVEAPLDVVGALESVGKADVVVLDCFTFWVSNLLLKGRSEKEILNEARRLEESMRGRPFHFVTVTNEVGQGVVPDSPLGRAFRDVVGLAHRRLAAVADEVYLGTMGVMLRLKPGPVEALSEDPP